MNGPLISADSLKRICWKTGAPAANIIAPVINKVCPLYGMSTLILHEFLANVLHESNEFCRYEENLNYSASRLMAVWPVRFKTIRSAQPYANNPQSLAAKVYNGRMGNTAPLDGWEYRGSGPIQMTGKDNFTRFASWMDRKFNITKTEQEWARLLRTDHEAGMHSACWIFSIAKELNDEALKNEMELIVRKINGGYNGLMDRLRYYELCKEYLL